jgi:hypothetical protein
VQPLWKPAQPQSEQRQLIPRDSFFLFVQRAMWELSQGLTRSLIFGLWDRKKLETRNPELETAKAQSRNAFGATADSSGYERFLYGFSKDWELSGFVLAATKTSLIHSTDY